MPSVRNWRDHTSDDFGVYIGRPSRWGNPFKIGEHGDRAKVIELYRDWLFTDSPEMALFRKMAKAELRGQDLWCYCAPLPCHGDVLLNLVN